MAVESMDPYPTGSAEYAATYLTTRGLGCLHPVKYHVDGTQQVPSKYPSRLGFFHFTAEESKISFLDTRKLCNTCLDLVVPNGFNFWSVYSLASGTSAPDQQAPKPRWLNMTHSSDSYPPLVQAGTEGFAHASLPTEGLPTRLTTPPVVLPIPKVPGAKEAWEWLQTERKPFYIDQLHLVKGWSLIVETRAKTDSLIAGRAGVGYCPEAQPKPKRQKGNSSGKGTALLEKGSESSTTTPPTAKNKTKVANDKFSVLPMTTESSSGIAKPIIVALGQRDYVFESPKPDHSEQYASLVQSTPSKAGRVSTKKKSTEKSAKKSSSTTKTSKTTEKREINTTSVGSASSGGGKKALKFTFTRDWGNNDLIPFDGSIVPLKLSDYKAQMTARPVIDPKSNYSLEKLMSGLKSTKGSISPGVHIETLGMAGFLRAAGIEESKTLSKSISKEKGIHGASPEDSTTKIKKTKSEHDIPSDDKSYKKQPTKDKPLVTIKTLVKQRSVTNESIQSTLKKDPKAPSKDPKASSKDLKTPGKELKALSKDPKALNKDPKAPGKNPKAPGKELKTPGKELKALGNELKGDGPRVVEPIKALKSRLSRHRERLPSLSFEHKPRPNFGNTKPRYPINESRSGKGKVNSGSIFSFGGGAGHSGSSKTENTESSYTETINMHNHYAETAYTGVSVNDTLAITQQSSVEDPPQSSDSHDSIADDGEEEEEIDHTSSDNDHSGDDNGQDSGTDSDSSGSGNDGIGGIGSGSDGDDSDADDGNGNDNDGDGSDGDGSDGSGSDSDDSDADDGNSDGNDGNGTDSDGSDATDSDHGESDGSGSDGSGVHSDNSDSDGSGSGGDSDDDGHGSHRSWDHGGSDSDD